MVGLSLKFYCIKDCQVELVKTDLAWFETRHRQAQPDNFQTETVPYLFIFDFTTIFQYLALTVL